MYESCKPNADLWWKPDTRLQHKFDYHSYILFYVDNILSIHHNPDDVLNKLNHYALLSLPLLIVPTHALVQVEADVTT